MPRKVAVVGTCASGKTSVTTALKERGFDAYAVAQEHSAIPNLWNHQQPERVVFLENSLETVRRRRADDVWPEWIYQVQLKRLAAARNHADIVVTTDDLSLNDVVDMVVEQLDQLSSEQR